MGKNINKRSILLFCISMSFYLFFFFIDGYVLCADSNSYIDMNFTREPFYSLYLDLLRMLFLNYGDFYLLVAVFGQSILAGFTAFSISNYLTKELTLPTWISLGILAMPLATSLLCRFVAQRGSMYSNSILTEGIAISIYLLFIRFCTEYLLHQTRKSFVLCSILCFIGISTRKQMYVLLVLFFISMIVRIIYKKNKFSLLKSLLTVICIIFFVFLFDRGYNYLVRGKFAGHVDDNRFVATMVFYTADREYADYIENDEIRQLFLDVYETCDENGYLMNHSPKGWFDEVTHFSDHYDLIQLNTLSLTLADRVPDMEYAKEIEFDSIRIDMVKSEMIKALLPHEIPRIVKVMFNNFLAGLVNTVAQRTHLLCIYSVIIYLGYVALFTCLIKRGKKNHFTNSQKAILVFSTLILVSIIANVTLVAAVIFCQTRYVIYNMAPFYIAGILMLYEFLKPLCKTAPKE